MEKPALKVEDISIRFNLSKEKVDNLKELIIKNNESLWWTAPHCAAQEK